MPKRNTTRVAPRGARTVRADGELTRLRILESAGQLFSTAGYAETTSKAIAAGAGVDLASINYHFGGRSGLYKAVLIEAHRRLVSLDDLRRIEVQDTPANEKLRQLFEILVHATRKPREWHARLFARELLAPSSALRAVFDEALTPKIAVVVGILSQVSGIARDDPALLRCLISTTAPCLMLLVASRDMPGPIGKVARMSSRELVNHLHAFTLGGLETAGRAGTGDRESRSPA